MPAGFFPAVEPDAPVFPLLDRLRPAVEAAADGYAVPGASVQAELRVASGPGGEVGLERFYWSAQQPDPGAPFGFRARTLHCSSTAERPLVLDFPSDPALDWLARDDGPLRADAEVGRVEVLRYIPLRRVTYRLAGAPGLPGTVIAKVKTTGGLQRAAFALMAVDRAAGRRRDGAPRVPQLLRLEPPRHVLYTDDLTGEPLDVAVRGLDPTDSMSRLGSLHRRLQRLGVRGLPVRRTADWLHDARRAVERVALFVPAAAVRAAAVYAELERTAPPDEGLVFCHGDFLPSQVLCDASGWSVIDFDDGRYAEPLSDVAAMYAGLPRELHLPGPEAEQARRTYLDAYVAEGGGALDEHRWRWFLVTHRLNELAKRIVKGRADGDETRSVLDDLASWSGEGAG